MCARLAILHLKRLLARIARAQLKEALEQAAQQPRHNIAPSQTVDVIREITQGTREITPLRWGLVPPWADDLKFGFRAINARAETIATLPTFRAGIQKRRCIVPVTGYYEWKQLGAKHKQPYYFSATDGEPLMLAGLWESWRSKDLASPLAQTTVETFTIITTTPNEAAAKIHDRMPVILDNADWDHWLNPDMSTQDVLPLLKPSPAESLLVVPVSTAVNNPRNDSPACIIPIDETQPWPAPTSKAASASPTEIGTLFD